MKLQLNNKERITQFNVLFQNLKAFSEHVILNTSKTGIFMQGMEWILASQVVLKPN